MRVLVGLSLVFSILFSVASRAHAEGRKWALLVGIDRYQRADVTPLRFAVADVKDLAATLKSTAGFRPDDVFVLTSDQTGDEAPTRTNVAYRLDWLRDHVKAGDTVLFFFSGHGMELDDAQSYLLTVEADVRSSSTLQDSSLDTRNLQKRLQGLPATQLLVFVDACRSDPRGGGRAGADNPLRGSLSRDLTLRPSVKSSGGAQVLATFFACSPGQRSYEWADRGHGFFSWYLIEGLKGKAAVGGRITLPGLISYLETQVSKSVERAIGKNQVPFMEAKGSTLSSWVLATVKGPQATASAPASAGGAVQAVLQEAERLTKLDKYREACAVYTTALAIDGQCIDAFLGRSSARINIFDIDGAIRDATKAVDLDGRNVKSRLVRARAYELKREYKSAIADCDAALEVDSRLSVARLCKARCRAMLGDFGSALEEVEKVIASDARCAMAYVCRASMQFVRDRRVTPSQFADMQTALDIDKRLPDAYYWRAKMNIMSDRPMEAIADYNECIGLTPYHTLGYTSRGALLLQLKKYPEALRDADKAIDLNKFDIPARKLRAYVLYQSGDKTAAVTAFRQLVQLDPAARTTVPAEIQSKL